MSKADTLTQKALASTIVPISTEHEWRSSPLPINVQYDNDLVEGSRIPLPPSRTCSDNGHEMGQELEQKTDSLIQPDEAEIQPRNSLDTPARATLALCTDIAESSLPHPCHNSVEGESPSSVNAPITLPLEELFQIIRKDCYETDCILSLQHQVHELMYACALSRRYTHLQSQLYRLMIDHFRSEDKTGFDLLYKNSIKLRKTCTTTAPSHLKTGRFHNSRPCISTHEHRLDSWVYRLSPRSRNSALQLLQKIRTTPAFLANRISALPYSQISSLGGSDYQQATAESVFKVQKHGLGGSPSPWDPRKYVTGPRSRNLPQEILSYDRFSLLLHATFDDSLEPGCSEYRRRVDVWSTVCARIIVDSKRGSDEFTMHILDDFASSHSWPLKPHLEIYLMELLQDGAFILESMENRSLDFTRPAELVNARSAIAASEFFDRAIKTLLGLVTSGASDAGMPKGMFEFVRIVLKKVRNPEKRIQARNFIVSRWYCTSFLSSTLVHPEIHGIMLRYHISTTARQKILHELATRLQKQVFEVLSPWKSTGLIGSDINAGIEKLLTLFETGNKNNSTLLSDHTPHRVESYYDRYLAFSPQDFLSLTTSLIPEVDSRTHSFSDLHNMSPMTSSSAGSSTLTSGTAPIRTGTASSNAASLSGTSMTSTTVLSEISAYDLDIECEINQDSKLNADRPIKQFKKDNDTFNLDLEILVHELKRLLETKDVSSSELEGPVSEGMAFFYIQGNGESITLTPTVDLTDNMRNSRKVHEFSSWETEIIPNLEGDCRVLIEAIARLCQDNALGIYLRRNANEDLKAQFRVQMNTCQADYDFQSAHFWWKSLQAAQRLPEHVLKRLLDDVIGSLQTRNHRRSVLGEQYNSWRLSLHSRRNISTQILRVVEDKCEALRDKMWYIADIKHSSTYENAMNITQALRSMARSSPSRNTSVAAWARHRLKSSIGFERTQIQTIEALAADQAHGGPTKLNDHQAELTSKWLTDQSVENFCKGEERIHRFCLEIHKCVHSLVGESLLKSPVLWSSSLYHHEGQMFGIGSRRSVTSGLQNLGRNEFSYPILTTPDSSFSTIFSSSPSRYNTMDQRLNPTLHTEFNYAYSSGSRYSGNPADLPRQSQLPSGTHSYFEAYSAPWSLAGPTPQPGATAHPSNLSSSAPIIPSSKAKQHFLYRLKETVTSLFLSDLGYLLWNRGSETDRWISYDGRLGQNKSEVLEVGPNVSESVVTNNFDSRVERNSSDSLAASGLPTTLEPDTLKSASAKLQGSTLDNKSDFYDLGSHFPYSSAYEKLLTKFSLSSDPFLKIRLLYEVTLLAKDSMQTSSISDTSINPTSPLITNSKSLGSQSLPDTPTVSKARTRATPLEEVIANCEERRRSTLPLFQIPPSRPSNPSPSFLQPAADPSTPDILPVLRTIISSSLRPPTLFRDLQYIAALVPPTYLDTTPQGRAFWAVGLAALSLKADACAQMVQRANEIVASHLKERPKKTLPERDPSGTARSTGANEHPPLETAAHLYTVAALEGDTTAARELALFYLTAPEIVPRVTLPLSRPGEVFRSASTSALGIGLGSEKGRAGLEGKDERLDPLTFAVAFHWMEFAANGGDGDAKAFLRENGELGKGR